MKESVNQGAMVTPMLFPYEPDQFWQSMREMIREEVAHAQATKPAIPLYETQGLSYKPLYKIAEVCAMFHVSKPTIYDWVKHGKLKPFKVRSRVYFLWQDIQQLFPPTAGK